MDNKIGFNTACEYLKQQLITNINNSQLPIGVAYYIIKDIFQEVEKTYYATLNKEAMENQEEVTTNLNNEMMEEQDG